MKLRHITEADIEDDFTLRETRQILDGRACLVCGGEDGEMVTCDVDLSRQLYRHPECEIPQELLQ